MKDKTERRRTCRNGLPQLRRRIAGLVSVPTQVTQRSEAFLVAHHFLQVSNQHTEMAPLLRAFVSDVAYLTDCTAVGIRVLESCGKIPYAAHRGFSKEFYEKESPLSINSDRCMCINVIKGTTDPALHFYTEYGSFYLNDTTRFFATLSEEERCQIRGECNRVGYESLGLIPIRLENDILGLIHMADTREDMVPPELVSVFEDVAMVLGSALSRVKAHEKVADYRDHVETLARERTEELSRVNAQLQDALARVKTLGGFVPICASCKRIRNDGGHWHEVEEYVRNHSEARFTHGICQECAERLYSGLPGESPAESSDDGRNRDK
jgi:transcriptional regulator with GAF, ATPase, and Fis domain